METYVNKYILLKKFYVLYKKNYLSRHVFLNIHTVEHVKIDKFSSIFNTKIYTFLRPQTEKYLNLILSDNQNVCFFSSSSKITTTVFCLSDKMRFKYCSSGIV